MRTLFIALSLFSLAAVGATGDVAKGEIDMSKSLVPQAKGIRTLFLSIYDPKSSMPMPMPVGAMKVDLKKDADAKVAEFKIDESSLMRMSPGKLPAVVDIKAKLDHDGNAGPDSAGDLVGWARGVKLGASHVKITIDKAVR